MTAYTPLPDTKISDTRVWTTLITNTKYLSGLITLDYSLKKVNSKYQLVALYTDTFELEGHKALDERGISKLHIQYLLPSSTHDYSNDPRFYDCWSKLQPFSLTEFDKVVQLDSDMLVIKNMDELFDIELNETNRCFAASHACVCNPLSFEHYPKDWIPQNCGFTNYHVKIPDSLKDDETLGPQPAHTTLAICNGGLQVVKPSKVLYDKIIAKLGEEGLNYEFADQSLLSDVFQGGWVGLSYVYNYLKTLRLIHKDLDFANVKNIHYIITPKPWDLKTEEQRSSYEDATGTFQYWYDINDERVQLEKTKGLNDGF
ncbi:hypothetical protein WICPIJ_001970 [Wickerhamomyces pijperi]|uniref:Glycosyltransferase family 8 protein n=1 Tax=Wickerhamomyces pijperi TaxID=599730 RepID=A0A9P8QAQ1_WICPI|nr:hypothetical protein WICPIJ_001970 [Wickerhamomyces pijperi]